MDKYVPLFLFLVRKYVVIAMPRIAPVIKKTRITSFEVRKLPMLASMKAISEKFFARLVS